jgi:hypothetical protein
LKSVAGDPNYKQQIKFFDHAGTRKAGKRKERVDRGGA